MTDPTSVDDISVVGQRRRTPAGSFPPSGGGGSGGAGGIHQNQVEMEDTPPPPMPAHPCNDPETAREWNADAAAAEALRRMLEAAAAQNDVTHTLYNREYGAMICENSDRSMSISPIQWGDPIFDADGTWVGAGQQPSVNVNFNSCGSGSIPIAMIHSHPSTGAEGGLPSASDATWISSINNARGDLAGRIYVVSIGD